MSLFYQTTSKFTVLSIISVGLDKREDIYFHLNFSSSAVWKSYRRNKIVCITGATNELLSKAIHQQMLLWFI